jgi:hypothetical protein
MYPLVINYGRMYMQAVDTSSPSYSGGFGTWLDLGGANDNGPDTVAPSSGATSWSAWLDLRSEPWVWTVPKTEPARSSTSRLLDPWGFVVDEVGSFDNRHADRMILLTSPTWIGEVPPGIDRVVHGESAFLRLLTRIDQETGPDDDPSGNIREQQALERLSAHLGRYVPAPTSEISWWPWLAGDETTDAFWSCASFALALIESHPDDAVVVDRIAQIGVAAGQPWDPASLGAEMAEGIGIGMDDALSELMRAAAHPIDPSLLHLSRAGTDRDYFSRALGALESLSTTRSKPASPRPRVDNHGSQDEFPAG